MSILKNTVVEDFNNIMGFNNNNILGFFQLFILDKPASILISFPPIKPWVPQDASGRAAIVLFIMEPYWLASAQIAI